ncbi:granzyme B-like [Archocentrus centrarchus]|uniref:granzyme B-like n=1 Tax=Archocentrus centrarchus TaxID=63155 RepID=UPI0011E9DC2A|nr:granzyme B-like [Archocentrus centrarchus]
MHCRRKFLLCVLTCLGGIELTAGISNGQKAPKESLPYMVSVQDNNGHVCGGFLISEDFVATSAHCDDSKLTHVVLGSQNLKKGYDEIITIEKKFKHPNYENVVWGSDIMLLKLSSKDQTGFKVQVIPLPPAEIKLKDNQVCQVAGWGLDDELRMTDVPVINPQVCQSQWCPSLLPPNIICAGGYGTNKGLCHGDGGGPLVCSGIAVGVVSFSKNSDCKYPHSPDVYTDISKHLQWINKILKQDLEVFKFCVRKRLM